MMDIDHSKINQLANLSLYDRTRNELRRYLKNHFPSDFDLESTITAYAYWVCTVVNNRGKDWRTTLQEYVDYAIRDAYLESQAEVIELNLLKSELQQADSPLLDIGAGWGRLADVYQSCDLKSYFVEPSNLGCQLLRRNGLIRSACCLGQFLSFPADSFQSVLIGWVLHHDAPDAPAMDILKEIDRVTCTGGRLFSVEPLSDDFNEKKWCDLLQEVGFKVDKLEIFFELQVSEKWERYAYLAARK